jgi:hypothetical protein
MHGRHEVSPQPVSEQKKMNKAKAESKAEKKKNERILAMVNPNAAGLDLHKETIWGCCASGAGAD